MKKRKIIHQTSQLTMKVSEITLVMRRFHKSLVEIEDTLKSYTVLNASEMVRKTPEEEFTLVELSDDEEEEEEKERKRIYKILDRLNDTFSTSMVVENTESQSVELTKYNEALKKLAERVSKIKVPSVHRRSIKEVEEIKNITFTKDRENMEETLNTTTEALNQLNAGDLQTLPRDQIVRMVKVLIALCKQNNSQIQSDISLIAQLDWDCFDFVAAHEQLEALRSYNVVLENEAETNRTEQKSLFQSINDLQIKVSNLLRERIQDGTDMSDLRQDKRNLETELKVTKEKLVGKANKLEDVEKHLTEAKIEHDLMIAETQQCKEMVKKIEDCKVKELKEKEKIQKEKQAN